MNRRAPGREKGRRTQARLLESAERVFVERGYLATRVADITKVAGVAHGSFYTYFDSKDDVFRQVVAGVVEDMYSALEPGAAGGSAFERIQGGNRRYLELYERHADILALIEQVATFDPHFRGIRLELRRRFLTRIERAVRRIQAEDHELGEPLDPWIVANALGGMVDNFSFACFVLGEPVDRDEALRTLDEIWRRALRIPSAPVGPASTGAGANGGRSRRRAA